jgi:hypothetical protein
LTREVAGERRRRNSGGTATGTQTVVKAGAGLNHVLHGKLPCGLGEILGRRLGSKDRRRGELGSGGPTAAAETRAPAIVQLGLINKRLGELSWCTRKAQELAGVRASTGGWFAPGGANGGTAGLGAGARAHEERPGAVFMGAGGQLGAREVTTTTRTCVERSRDGRRRAPLRRPMARHERCAGRWIYATWRGPLATDGTGVLPPAQRSDQRSLRRLGVRTRRGYSAYGGLPTWPRTTSRRGASRAFPGVCISLKQLSS